MITHNILHITVRVFSYTYRGQYFNDQLNRRYWSLPDYYVVTTHESSTVRNAINYIIIRFQLPGQTVVKYIINRSLPWWARYCSLVQYTLPSLVPRLHPQGGEGLVTQAQFLELVEVLKPCNCKCRNANWKMNFIIVSSHCMDNATS